MLIGISFNTLVTIHAIKKPNMSPKTAAERFLTENLLMTNSMITMRDDPANPAIVPPYQFEIAENTAHIISDYGAQYNKKCPKI
jgi:hypothetical protein